MAVHTIHIFDRKGKTLFTKRYFPSSGSTNTSDQNIDSEQLSEQRKLVFGMIYSLREITKLLAPAPLPSAMNHNQNNNTATTDTGLHSVRTGASTLHTYETSSGLRICIFTTNHTLTPGHLESSSAANDKNMTTTSVTNLPVVNGKVVRVALQYIYHELWIQCVTRSPLYTRKSMSLLERIALHFLTHASMLFQPIQRLHPMSRIQISNQLWIRI